MSRRKKPGGVNHQARDVGHRLLRCSILKKEGSVRGGEEGEDDGSLRLWSKEQIKELLSLFQYNYLKIFVK